MSFLIRIQEYIRVLRSKAGIEYPYLFLAKKSYCNPASATFS
jgi:hypothetical protein